MAVSCSIKIQLPFVKSSKLVSHNIGLEIVFWLITILSLGLFYILSLYFPSLHNWVYVDQSQISKASALVILFENQKTALSKIVKQKLTLPLVDTAEILLMANVNETRLYFDPKAKAFLRLGDFLVRKIRWLEDSGRRVWARGLSRKRAVHLAKTFGKSSIASSKEGFFTCIIGTLGSPVIVLQMIGVVGFYLNHLFLLSIFQTLFLFYAVFIMARRRLAKSKQLSEHVEQSESLEVFRYSATSRQSGRGQLYSFIRARFVYSNTDQRVIPGKLP